MKKFLVFTTLSILALNAMAQSNIDTATIWPQNSTGNPVEDKRIFTIVEEMPSFPGGDEAMYKFLSDNVVYPAVAKENSIKGSVYVSFVVRKEGKITDAKVLRGIEASCDKEALRVVNLMPAWKPGKQNGKEVNVQYNLRVTFGMDMKK